MAYYLMDIDHKCQCGCGKRANTEMKTSGSSPSYGFWNRACGEREAKRRNEKQEREWAARQDSAS